MCPSTSDTFADSYFLLIFATVPTCPHAEVSTILFDSTDRLYIETEFDCAENRFGQSCSIQLIDQSHVVFGQSERSQEAAG